MVYFTGSHTKFYHRYHLVQVKGEGRFGELHGALQFCAKFAVRSWAECIALTAVKGWASVLIPVCTSRLPLIARAGWFHRRRCQGRNVPLPQSNPQKRHLRIAFETRWPIRLKPRRTKFYLVCSDMPPTVWSRPRQQPFRTARNPPSRCRTLTTRHCAPVPAQEVGRLALPGCSPAKRLPKSAQNPGRAD